MATSYLIYMCDLVLNEGIRFSSQEDCYVYPISGLCWVDSNFACSNLCQVLLGLMGSSGGQVDGASKVNVNQPKVRDMMFHSESWVIFRIIASGEVAPPSLKSLS